MAGRRRRIPEWRLVVVVARPTLVPATELLGSHNSSVRGACGFVLTANPKVTQYRVMSEWATIDSESARRKLGTARELIVMLEA